MAEVELFCAVYGEGTAFSVKIALDASVYALQKAIAETLSTKQHTIVPWYLTLYLARKNGVWLQGDDDKVCAYLRGKVDEQLEIMRSWRMLDDADYFGSNFTPGRGQIHVLVELPEAAIDVVSKQPTLSQMIKEIHEQVVQTKRKRYVHSEMTLSKGHALLRQLNIKVQPVSRASLATEVSTPVEAYKWKSIISEDDREIVHFKEQQREQYRAYLEDNIGEVLVKKKLCVFGVEKDDNFLSVTFPDHDIELVGRTDILVLSDCVKKDPSQLKSLPDVRMLIEVKWVMTDSSIFQALSELIALDFLVAESVIALLTNLTDCWQFFWFSKNNRHVIQTAVITDPSEAFALIRKLLAEAPAAKGELSLPCAEASMKRCKLDEVLPAISEGSGDSIRESIERYCGFPSAFGPDVEMADAVAD